MNPKNPPPSPERAFLDAMDDELARQSATLDASLEVLRQIGDANLVVAPELLEELEELCRPVQRVVQPLTSVHIVRC